MKKLLTQILSVGAVLALGASAAVAAEGWGDNYTKAKAQAKAEKKLLLLDFPQTKPQAAPLKQQNARLQAQYKIQGFPTIVVLNGEGKKVGELGYQPGGPAAFIAELDKMKK